MLAKTFITGIRGKKLDDEFTNFIKEYKPYGFIIFSDNVGEKEELREFIYSVKGKFIGYKPLFFVDEEGGRVKRIETDFPFPSPYEIGQLYEEGKIKDEDIFEIGKKVGETLKFCGIDFNFAPVLDLRFNEEVIGDRSFSRNERTVARVALNFILGMHSKGVFAIPKHFPGHGIAGGDSHKSLPVSKITYDELGKHIFPFKEIAKYVKGIMMAHIVVECVDKYPAPLSPKVIAILRSFYQGAILTDDILMGALSNFGSPEEIAALSIKAGCDIVLISSKDIKLLSKTFDNFFKFVKEDTELKEKLLRVKKLK